MLRSSIRAYMVAALTVAIMIGAATGAQANKELTKVVFAECARSEGWLPVHLAQTLGFFEEEGLDPEFITYKDGPLALMGLLNGDAEFCIIGFEPVLMAYEKGQSSKVIMTTLDSQPYTFVSRPELTSAADFKGKVVFAGMPGSAPYFFVKTILRNAGVDPDKEVTFASLEYGAELVAINRGQIDGAYVRATRFKQIEEMGGRIILDATIPAKHKEVYGSEKYQAMSVQVRDDYIKEHPEIVQAFSNAVYKGILWQMSHSDEEIAKAVAPMFPGRNIDAGLISVLRKCWSTDGLYTEEGYNSVIDFCVANGVIKTHIPMRETVDNSFMEKAKANIH